MKAYVMIVTFDIDKVTRKTIPIAVTFKKENVEKLIERAKNITDHYTCESYETGVIIWQVDFNEFSAHQNDFYLEANYIYSNSYYYDIWTSTRSEIEITETEKTELPREVIIGLTNYNSYISPIQRQPAFVGNKKPQKVLKNNTKMTYYKLVTDKFYKINDIRAIGLIIIEN